LFSKRLAWSFALIFALLGCLIIIGLGIWFMGRRPAVLSYIDPPPSPIIAPLPTVAPVLPPTATPTVPPSPSPTPAPPTGSGQASPLPPSTEELLTQAVLPERDQRLLAMRLKYNGQEIPIVTRHAPFTVNLGSQDTFWITDHQQQPPRQFEVTATLKYITPHTYWWVQEGFEVAQDALAQSAERFETQTYPTNRAFFGSEWSPGVDDDVHIHVFMGGVPGVAGYFAASNEYSRLAEPYSNERELFFINLQAMQPGNDYFNSVLAHEFQHMIHWQQDRNEETWVNEGLSELASFINQYGGSKFVGSFTATPDTQLTGWADSPGAAGANYGGSFLFMAYFLQRYGEKMTQAVVANPQNGIAGFNAVLAEHGFSERFNDILADFLAANYLQNPSAGDGRWGYKDLSPNPVALAASYSTYPQQQQATVSQYGGDYIEIIGQGQVTIAFTGTTQVKVINNDAHSGRYQWYSHRGDEIDTSLTRAFDLRGVKTATLTYWTWYDIESSWDYGYVEISTDGGQTWQILSTAHTTADNPSGSAYGPGYTGVSGTDGPAWIAETIDLSAYAGHEVQLRFEYVTDDAVNRPGWTIDDISLPEIGFTDDVESGPDGWQAQGFVRMDNILPQKFLVQALEIGDTPQVVPLPLDQTNRGALTITGLGDNKRAVLVISGLTPITTQPAGYEYRLTP
jgi:immune inhibitor A